MKQQVILIAIACGFITAGCSVPNAPALRIAISTAPGSAVLYLAQETGLFKQYGVDVHIVELTSGCECCIALTDGHVDAVAIPFDEMLDMQGTTVSAGIILLLASSENPMLNFDHLDSDEERYKGEIEVLAGKRSDLMLRRKDWQRVLMAYEHARMLLAGEPKKHAETIALRESRSADEFLRDLNEWTVFGILQQDSLLGETGPFKAIKAHWQGRHVLTESTSKIYMEKHHENAALNGNKAK